MTNKLLQARANAGTQVAIWFCFAFDWSREKREFFFNLSQGVIKQSNCNLGLILTVSWMVLSFTAKQSATPILSSSEIYVSFSAYHGVGDFKFSSFGSGPAM